MHDLATAIEASGLADLLRQSRWTYPAVNAAHLLGVALLVGAIVPMDLRLIGVWRGDVGLRVALRLLRPMAAFGAGLAVLTGAMLFTVQATDYAGMPLFWLKIGLIGAGLGHAVANGAVASAARNSQRLAGAVSLAVWIPVLVIGRLVGYL